MSERKTLLVVVEQDGYPDLLQPCHSNCFDTTVIQGTRKALAHIKRYKPDVIIAGFVFCPTYGSQLSNFEALLAGIQRDVPQVKLIAIFDRKDEPHLDKVCERFRLSEKFAYPLNKKMIEECLHKYAQQ